MARTNQEFLLCSKYDVMLHGAREAMTAWYQASRFLAKVHRPFWARVQTTSITTSCPYLQSAGTSRHLQPERTLSALSHQPPWQLRSAKLSEGEEHCRTFSPQTWFSITRKQPADWLQKALQWQQPSDKKRCGDGTSSFLCGQPKASETGATCATLHCQKWQAYILHKKKSPR